MDWGLVLFQSTPNLSAGCSIISRALLGRAHAYFNPHPAEMLGATRSYEVSILTQHFSWAQVAVSMILVCFNSRPASWLGAGGTLSLVWTKGIVVSVLAQSLCWAWVAVTIALLCFNSHSTSSAGCNSVRSSFNPRPAYWLGAGGGSYNPGVFQFSPNLSVGCRWRYP